MGSMIQMIEWLVSCFFKKNREELRKIFEFEPNYAKSLMWCYLQWSKREKETKKQSDGHEKVGIFFI
jgi:hypothetical protein